MFIDILGTLVNLDHVTEIDREEKTLRLFYDYTISARHNPNERSVYSSMFVFKTEDATIAAFDMIKQIVNSQEITGS